MGGNVVTGGVLVYVVIRVRSSIMVVLLRNALNWLRLVIWITLVALWLVHGMRWIKVAPGMLLMVNEGWASITTDIAMIFSLLRIKLCLARSHLAVKVMMWMGRPARGWISCTTSVDG